MKTSQDSFVSRFLGMESSGGIVLMAAGALAMILANTPMNYYYNLLLDTPMEIRIGGLEIAKPLLLWINDGLMAVFFFLVGLELKRELTDGVLADRRNIILPAAGAIGGMVVPALFYIYFNSGNPAAMRGWAIPAATDIAFALGILSLLGSRVPTSIKVFLTSLAIFDDIGAILIIALFYTQNISLTALLFAVCCIPVLVFFNRRGIEAKSLYITVGVVMWVAMLKSGVHATLTGVILAMFIPMESKIEKDYSPLKSLETDLHFSVAFIILPVFAFANAGINVIGLSAEQVFHSVPTGIASGLFLGKQIGIFGLCMLFIKLGFAKLPEGMTWGSLYGTAALCGVGFTMSLFIGSLAFEETGTNLLFDERLGIIIGSVASAIVGYIVLRASLNSNRE